MNWISVKDRLPEDRQNCLIWDGEHIEKCVFERTTFISGEKSFSFVRDGCFCCQENEKVTHWIPLELPAPPNGAKLKELFEDDCDELD